MLSLVPISPPPSTCQTCEFSHDISGPRIPKTSLCTKYNAHVSHHQGTCVWRDNCSRIELRIQLQEINPDWMHAFELIAQGDLRSAECIVAAARQARGITPAHLEQFTGRKTNP